MTPSAEQVLTCANCGRSFHGRYCPDCGQDLEDLRRPFAEITRDFLGDFLAFDARLWRTLVPLFTRPGVLTVDYVEGRRARYVPPLKLYVFAGFLYFTVVAIGGGGPFAPRITNQNGDIVFGFGQAPRVADREEPKLRTNVDGIPAGEGPSSRLQERAERAAEDPESFGRAVYGTLSYAHFLLLPLLGLLLEALYRKRYYAEHLVFGMHFHAFALIPAAAIAALFEALSLDPDGWIARWTRSVWGLVLATYLGLALRRVYGQGVTRTLVNLAALGISYMLVAAIVITVVSFLTIFFY